MTPSAKSLGTGSEFYSYMHVNKILGPLVLSLRVGGGVIIAG